MKLPSDSNAVLLATTHRVPSVLKVSALTRMLGSPLLLVVMLVRLSCPEIAPACERS